jgi:tetratricopeptide (TPR) repeat protein
MALSYLAGTWRGTGTAGGFSWNFITSRGWELNNRCLVERMSGAYGTRNPYAEIGMITWDPVSETLREWGVNHFGHHWGTRWRIEPTGDFFTLTGTQKGIASGRRNSRAKLTLIVQDEDNYVVVTSDRRHGDVSQSDMMVTYRRRPPRNPDAPAANRLATLRKLSETNPEVSAVHVLLGDLLAQRRDFDEAAACFSKAFELRSDDPWLAYRLAPLLRTVNQDKFRKHCAEMRKRYDNPEDTLEYGRALQVCLLHPEAIDDWEQLAEEAKENAERVESQPLYNSRRAMAGMACFRAKQFEDAIDWLEWAKQQEGANQAIVKGLLALSMTYSAMEKTANARQCLELAKEKAAQVFEADEEGDLTGGWHDWLICNIMREEAEELLP